MSYALNSTSDDPLQRQADYNHFSIHDPLAVQVCHDFPVRPVSLWSAACSGSAHRLHDAAKLLASVACPLAVASQAARQQAPAGLQQRAGPNRFTHEVGSPNPVTRWLVRCSG